MDLKQLYTFRMIATLGSFNQAADQLRYAQSTVSEQIKALETDLDVKLFNRSGKRVSLTPAGDLFFQYAQKLINLEDEIRTEIKECNDVVGALTIKIPETISSFYLPPILNKFQKQYPQVDLNFNPCSLYGLNDELRSGMINCAFLIAKEFKDPELEVEYLLKVPLVLVTYPKSPLASKNVVTLADITSEPVFAPTSDCSYFKMLEEIIITEKLKFSAVYRSNSVTAIKKNIMAGTGCSVLPEIAVQEEIANGLLIKLPLDKRLLEANVLMIRLRNTWHPPILDAFMKITRESICSVKPSGG